MRTRALLVGLAVLTAGLWAAGYFVSAQEPEAEPKRAAAKPAGEFAGKVVYVQTRAGVRAATLDKAEIRTLGGRTFLVGKAISDEVLTQKQFFTGSQLWLPVEDIESMAVFDSL